MLVLFTQAHAMTPFQGQGAGQAIEDACVLSTLLARALSPSSKHVSARNILDRVSRALRVYDSVRRPIALDVLQRSRRNGRLFTYAYPPAGASEHSMGEYMLMMSPAEMQDRVIKNWQWSWAAGEPSPGEGVRRQIREAMGLWEKDTGRL
jgi:salicylate hydroxylase